MLGLDAALLLTLLAPASAYTMVSRWGHAATYLASPPALLIQGGKTDPTSGYTYTSAPNTADTLLLLLDADTTTSTAAFTALAAGPSYAWHCLAPLSASSALAFGGDGAGESVETLADSAWAANLSSTAVDWTHEPTDWASQPARRIYHACAADVGGGTVYITGGEKDDGSGSVYADVAAYSPAAQTFAALPPLPQPLFHHVSALLPNGTLVVLAGAYVSADTDTVALLSASTVFALDTTSPTATWATLTAGGTLPEARRGATASLSANGTALLLLGGADAALDQVFSDALLLDLETLVWTEVGAGGPSARFDHTAVSAGDQVIIFGGYANSAPADADLYIFDMSSASFVSTFDSTSSSDSVSSAVSADTTGVASANAAPGGGGATTTIVNGLGSAATSTATDGSTTASSTGLSGSATSDAAGRTDTDTSGLIGTTATPSSSGTAIAGQTEAAAATLSTPAKVGLIIGVCGLAGLAGCMFIWACCRRRRKYTSTYSSSRPYGSREKSGAGLMDAEAAADAGAAASPGPKPKPALSLGSLVVPLSGAIGSLRNRVASGDAYARLAEDGGRLPTRWPTRKVGRGIRLVGAPVDSDDEADAAAGAAVPRRTRSIGRELRIDMFADEDSVSDDDWLDAEELARSRRRPRVPSTVAEDSEGSARARIAGGPVPTPRSSDLLARPAPGSDPAGAYLLPAFSPSDPLDLGSLLGRRARSGADDASLPRSQRSAATTATASASSARSGRSAHSGETFGTGHSVPSDDLASAVISHASVHPHAAPSLLSPSSHGHGGFAGYGSHGSAGPDPSPGLSSSTFGSPASMDHDDTYEPIRRSASFLQRMTGSLRLGAAARRPAPAAVFDVRDPHTPPALWPIESQTYLPAEPGASRSGSDGSRARAHGHGQRDSRASLASLQSARSMRDMVVVLRETTASSAATDVVIEHAEELAHDGHVAAYGHVAGHGHVSAHGRAGRDDDAVYRLPEGGAAARTRAIVGPDETPGSVVFDGGLFASPPGLPSFTVRPRAASPARQARSAAPSPVARQPNTLEAPVAPSPASPASPASLAPLTLASPQDTPTRPLLGSSTARLELTTPETPTTPTRAAARAPSPASPASRASPDASFPTPTRASASPFAPRRPVRDVVKSINRRSAASLAGSFHSAHSGLSGISANAPPGTGTPPRAPRAAAPAPPDVLSPASSYSPQPDRAKRGTYEAVRKGAWVVANPDGAEGSGGAAGAA